MTNLTISIVKKTTKEFISKEGEPQIEPEIKEKVISEFRTDSKTATAILELLTCENNYPTFDENGNLEFNKWTGSEKRVDKRIEEEIIIRFINK